MYINGPGHMTKIPARKKYLKIFLRPRILSQALQSFINHEKSKSRQRSGPAAIRKKFPLRNRAGKKLN